MDTARMRMSEFVIDELVLPIMLEIEAAAKAAGIELPVGIEQKIIRVDPTDTAFVPSMGQDAAKVCSLVQMQIAEDTD
jgi:ketopantoate reductase